MNIKLKDFILSAFSDYLKPGEDDSGYQKFTLKTAKSDVRHLFANESELEPLWDSESLSQLIELFLWPCNAYAVCASLLARQGGYRILVSQEACVSWSQSDTEEVKLLGGKWFNFIDADFGTVKTIDITDINNLLLSVFEYRNLHKYVDELMKCPHFKKNLLKVCLCADESFKDVDVLSPLNNSISGRIVEFLNVNNDVYEFQLSYTNKSFGSVHYKSTICQSGISINSVAGHLALVSPEVRLKYVERLHSDNSFKCDNYNVLILPWPLCVRRTDFNVVDGSHVQEMSSDFGFFEYAPKLSSEIDSLLEILEKSFCEFNEIDLIVLPECALNSEYADEFFLKIKEFCQLRLKYIPTLITGVFSKGSNDRFGVNALKLFTVSEPYDIARKDRTDAFDSVVQHKHHRWFLDRAQLHNYKLGNRLSPKKKWWEFTKVDERSLISYYCQRQDILITPLICEDLARQDPVAPVIRALGPNLIIALLLDGPQIKTRWPGRYASLLSEDPGSSVLTLTPLGMTMRSDGTGFPPSREVAFWSEPDGSYRELSLNEGKNAIVLTLEPGNEVQWSADGRKSERIVLKYAGHICI